ncbi:MAG: ABC transporter permease subunit [Bacteriovoracaceae bacterium]|nr:ABC transporter permease subunit [Bacteriovoracaceae bacterium]
MTKLILSLLLLTLLQPSIAQNKPPIVIGSKIFSESIILAEIAAQLFEDKGVKVVRKTNLGGTKVVFDALNAGDIDLYPDYTGTGYVMILKQSGETDPQVVYEIVSKEFSKKFSIAWSAPLGFNNTYSLAVRKDDEQFKNINNISDLSNTVERNLIASPHEFMERQDGFNPFKSFYNLNFKSNNVKSLSSGLMYSAIRDKQVDLIISYSTDGRLGAYGLKLLKDDKKFFPPYYAAFLTREEVLQDRPEVAEVFEELEQLISEQDMIKMNDLVDREKREPSEVAKNFLIEKGLLQGTKTHTKISKNFLSYVVMKKNYLWKIVKEHLLLSFGALFLALAISLPTGILLSRKPKLSSTVFPFINTVQTIPSLALLGFLIPFLGIGYAPAVIALFLYSLLPLVRNTYTGIESVDQDYIEASRGIGLTDWQILLKVEIPLALPVILAGIRTASVIVIGTATLAALVGAGGLGDPIFRGVATVNSNLILLGAVPSALLAIIVDKALGYAETKLVSQGLRARF